MVDTPKEEPKTKTRQRLTMTAMYDAINDLFFATLPAEQRAKYALCTITTGAKPVQSEGDIVYVAGLFSRGHDQAESTFVVDAEHPDGVEEATAALLGKVRERFEARRKELLSDLDSVTARHDGALRGARSKIRERKT